MCRDCGCQEATHMAFAEKIIHDHHESHDHEHAHHHPHHHPHPPPHHHHEHSHDHDHEHWIDGKWIRHSHSGESGERSEGIPRRVLVEQSILARNDRIAEENRKWFEHNGIRVLNLMSSPGSGKTLLLEKTVQLLRLENPKFKMMILTGDQERDFDAQRLKAAGADVFQLNTASSCHLDASMIQKQLGTTVRPIPQLLIIENVGNLVCPAAFDLGENQKVALLSTPEGEDKPSKYPLLFHEANLIVITKIDLVPYLDWNLEACEKHIRSVNSSAPLVRLSAKTGEGMDDWLRFVTEQKSNA